MNGMAAPQTSSARQHRPRRSMRDEDGGESLTEILHLREYWRTVRKRIWTLVTAFSLIVVSVSLVTLLTAPVYEASSSLQIDAQPQAYNNLNAMGIYGTGQYQSDQDYFSTQHRKLRARVQAKAVMDRLNLWEHEDFKDADEPVQLLLELVTIEPVAKTRLVWVYARNNDPELAQQIGQAWGEVFVERNLQEVNQGVSDGLQFLSDETARTAAEMKDAEGRLLAFRQEHNTIALSTEEKSNLVTQQLEELSRKKASAQADVASRQSERDSMAKAMKSEKDPRRLSLLVSASVMDKLRESYASRLNDHEALSVTYLENHPKMVEINGRLRDVEQQIQNEVRAEFSRREAAWRQALDQESLLDAAINRLTSDTLDGSSEESLYNLLRSTVDSKKDIYQQLVAKQQEMSVASSLKENNVRIIDPAEVKKDPVEPNYTRNFVLAVIAGLLTGVSLAFFFDYMDTTIKTREEVEALGIPFLGIIPSVPGLAGDGWEMARERYLYAFNYPKSAFAEFCRNIRTNVNFMARSDGEPPRRLLITSSGPREGKTTSSINLGITFASTGRRVCLVDADLRRPSLHHAFGLPNDRGFSSLIHGDATAEEVCQATPQAGLFILPSGPRPPNPAEQLGSVACHAALDKLNEIFDLVIIDSPPVVAVTDAVVLATHVDGVIMVIKSFKVARDLVAQAKRQLTDVDARLIGVILNDFDIQRKSYGYYYYYTYYGADRDEVGKATRS